MNPHEIVKAFGGKLIAKPRIKIIIAEVVMLFPPEIINTLLEKVWFFSSSDDAWAYTFKGNDLKNMHLIFLSDELFTEPLEQIRYTIAHEIGHVILGHENSIDRKQTQSEIRRQEQEADQFAKKYLNQA